MLYILGPDHIVHKKLRMLSHLRCDRKAVWHSTECLLGGGIESRMLDSLADGDGSNNRGVLVERLVPVKSQSVTVRWRTWLK